MYKDISVVEPSLLSCLEPLESQQVLKLLAMLGVHELEPQQLLDQHIYPTIQSNKWKVHTVHAHCLEEGRYVCYYTVNFTMKFQGQMEGAEPLLWLNLTCILLKQISGLMAHKRLLLFSLASHAPACFSLLIISLSVEA